MRCFYGRASQFSPLLHHCVNLNEKTGECQYRRYQKKANVLFELMDETAHVKRFIAKPCRNLWPCIMLRYLALPFFSYNHRAFFFLPDKNGHVHHIGRGVDIAWKENCVCVCVFLVIYELGGTDFPDLNNRGWCWVSDISRRLDPELTLWNIHFLKLFMAFRMLEIFPPNGTILDVLSAHDSGVQHC